MKRFACTAIETVSQTQLHAQLIKAGIEILEKAGGNMPRQVFGAKYGQLYGGSEFRRLLATKFDGRVDIDSKDVVHLLDATENPNVKCLGPTRNKEKNATVIKEVIATVHRKQSDHQLVVNDDLIDHETSIKRLPVDASKVPAFLNDWKRQFFPTIMHLLGLDTMQLSREQIASLQKLIPLAFIHPSSCFTNPHRQSIGETLKLGMQCNYETLELVGDAALSLAVTDRIFHRMSSDHFPEGHMSLLRQKIVQGESCAAYAKAMGFPFFLICGQSVHDSTRVANDLAESVLGAVFSSLGKDGYAAVVKIIFELYLPRAITLGYINPTPEIKMLLDMP